MKKAELLINGPKGVAFAEIEIDKDGATIHPAMAECALAHALNLYNELPNPKKESSKELENDR